MTPVLHTGDRRFDPGPNHSKCLELFYCSLYIWRLIGQEDKRKERDGGRRIRLSEGLHVEDSGYGPICCACQIKSIQTGRCVPYAIVCAYGVCRQEFMIKFFSSVISIPKPRVRRTKTRFVDNPKCKKNRVMFALKIHHGLHPFSEPAPSSTYLLLNRLHEMPQRPRSNPHPRVQRQLYV